MASAELKLAAGVSPGMDRKIHHKRWSMATWPLGAKIGLAIAALALMALSVVRLIGGSGVRTLRLPVEHVTIDAVKQGIFHDLIPLRANVVPRETVYIDAIDGGRVDRLLVELGDLVRQGQPLIELSNTNLALQVIQQVAQLNQAISQLQQNEIALEQNRLSNDRALTEIDYNLIRLERSSERRQTLAVKGAVSQEQRDVIADELAHYRRLRPIQAESGRRQSDLRERLLPGIHEQLKMLRANLDVVHSKQDALIIRSPVAGRVTAIDLKVGENRNPGERLAEITPDSGMKLSADLDEYYLSRVRVSQTAIVDFNGKPTQVTVRRVSPQVRNGRFSIDLDFEGPSPPDLVSGEATQGRLQLGGASRAVLLPTRPFLARTGGNWLFVVSKDGSSADRRRIKLGRRSTEQLEILGGLVAGERAITSDYTGFDNVDRIIFTH